MRLPCPRFRAPARSAISSTSSCSCRRTVRSTITSAIMRGVRGYNDRFPIPLPGGQPVWYQPSKEDRDATGAAVPSEHADDQRAMRRRSRPLVVPDALRDQQRPLRPVARVQDRHDDGLLPAQRHSVSLRAGRCLHRLRRLLLLAAGPDAPEPFVSDDRHGRSDRHAWAARCSTTTTTSTATVRRNINCSRGPRTRNVCKPRESRGRSTSKV